MRCDYCGLALSVDEPGPLHEMCAKEVRPDQLDMLATLGDTR